MHLYAMVILSMEQMAVKFLYALHPSQQTQADFRRVKRQLCAQI